MGPKKLATPKKSPAERSSALKKGPIHVADEDYSNQENFEEETEDLEEHLSPEDYSTFAAFYRSLEHIPGLVRFFRRDREPSKYGKGLFTVYGSSAEYLAEEFFRDRSTLKLLVANEKPAKPAPKKLKLEADKTPFFQLNSKNDDKKEIDNGTSNETNSGANKSNETNNGANKSKTLVPKDEENQSGLLYANIRDGPEFISALNTLLFKKFCRVEIWHTSSKKKNSWTLQYQGSPGNIEQLDEWISDVNENFSTMAVSIKSESDSTRTIGICIVDINLRKLSIAEFPDDNRFSSLEVFFLSLVALCNFLIKTDYYCATRSKRSSDFFGI